MPQYVQEHIFAPVMTDDFEFAAVAIPKKITLLNKKMAQENRGWFNEEEYSQLPVMLTKTEEELKEAEAEYEKVKTKYARETVTRMIEESFDTQTTERTDALEGETLP